jgi:multiple sugar transport system ATP-binding protein
MAEVQLTNISKRFDGVNAVDGLNLTIKDGELVVLLGPTGAGKTTTLRLIAGLEKPEEGSIFIDHKEVTDTPPAKRDIAMVFQEYSLYPHFSVYDNMAFPLRSPMRRLSENQIREKVHQVAKLLKIEHKLENKGTKLSGGEMQRVSIGRALVRDPAAFLMDEPLSSLDAKLRDDLRLELKRIQIDLNATFCYVTHDQMEAMTLADRIGVLSEGCLLQMGTPEEIYQEPLNIHVACRLGSPSINLLPPSALGIKSAPEGTYRLGIRPENILIGDTGISTTIKSVEHLGVETVIQLSIEDYEVAALAAPGKSYFKGEQVSISTIPEKVLYFNKAGDRII